MGYPLKKESEKKFTRTDYLAWPEDERWEIIDGEAYCMTPAPSIRHQDIVINLATQLKQKLGGGPCRTFVAPTDVVLSGYDVVQPDILVVCDKKKITDANVQGAPDLIIEVLSPYTSLKDKRVISFYLSGDFKNHPIPFVCLRVFRVLCSELLFIKNASHNQPAWRYTGKDICLSEVEKNGRSQQ